ncbi:twitching motility protein PilT [Halolactibacillus alkaliphilus]|uniref:Twitching motility protein PilT n=1 Tax=Halolactibacillus alkaliphilus TaxID=442899 RepID=A0A511WXY6_9BACI|nr:type IV pilus twitching motility protein PilT [Halolactibacillus alkaliphilus]GEN55986.1 twitching motility protein PilT [Halolactibacillus alkaliphilus]GGN68239.1 twitching motility protein PilT [Halolactibacillus alkaliphilus]SFO69401.1 twitching motility protein PilT [Halolactibacillus alkaliphilus]
MDVKQLLQEAMACGASDLHLTVGSPPVTRIDGDLKRMSLNKLSPEDTELLVKSLLTEEQFNLLNMNGEIDFSYALPGTSRFRVNAYRQRGSYAMALRTIPIDIPSIEKLYLPDVTHALINKRRGLILVTGPTGSGKSTTLASMINYVNQTRKEHIITLEDPIEYLHKHNESIVNQREIGTDSKSFGNSLRASLRQDPDVILVGEMRDLETISTALTAAETGHLVLATLHTIGAPKTIDRIIDVFPPYQQQQIRIQLAGVLEGIISQQLLPREGINGRRAAFEVLVATPAVRNLIREGKTHQILSAMQTGGQYGMITMDKSLISLYEEGEISKENLYRYASDLQYVKTQIGSNF